MKNEGLSLEQHIKACEKSGPRVLTLNMLSCLTEKYKTFSHELPRLIILENVSKALMDTTVEEMSDFLDDWVTEVEESDSQLREDKKAGWLNNTHVMDLDVSCPRSRDVPVEELRRAGTHSLLLLASKLSSVRERESLQGYHLCNQWSNYSSPCP